MYFPLESLRLLEKLGTISTGRLLAPLSPSREADN